MKSKAASSGISRRALVSTIAALPVLSGTLLFQIRASANRNNGRPSSVLERWRFEAVDRKFRHYGDARGFTGFRAGAATHCHIRQ